MQPEAILTRLRETSLQMVRAVVAADQCDWTRVRAILEDVEFNTREMKLSLGVASYIAKLRTDAPSRTIPRPCRRLRTQGNLTVQAPQEQPVPQLTIEQHMLQDDGTIPNNPRLPLIHYRAAFAPGDRQRIEDLFAANGWSNAWVNGIYPFHHYHATTHEVLGIAAGSARVQFGGPGGPIVEVSPGDAVMIPAGVGHCCLSHATGLVVVGAYPGGSEWDLRRANPADYQSGKPLIAKVADPVSDPIVGAGGPACCAER